jgi:site-specific DNA recombinase
MPGNISRTDRPMTTKQKTAALYARFSSDLQKDRSLDDQFAVCETYAKREDFKVISTFHDRAKSGATLFDRDGLLDLMTAAKARKFNAVIVENLDRLSRDQEDLAGIYKKLEFYGIKLHAINEGKTTPIHMGIRGLVGSLFLKDLGEKVKRGHNGRVRAGKFPGSVTYGYDRVLGKPGDRQINQEHAAVLRRIFTEYADGISPRVIATGLTRDGIPTPRVGTKHWNHQSIGGGNSHSLLCNRLYIGEIVWNKHHTVQDPETGSKHKRTSPEAERVITAVPELRIIDQKLWDAAQKVRESGSLAKFGPGGIVRTTPIVRDMHLLSGLLRCGVCTGKMIITNKCRGKQYVACAAAHSKSACSHRKMYDIDILKHGVLNGFRDNLIDPEAIAETARSFHAEYEAEVKRNSSERLAAEKQRNRLVIQIDRLVSAITDSDQPLPALLSSLKAKEAERVGLEERIRLLGAANVVTLHPNVIDDYRANVDRLHKALTENPGDPDNRTAFRNMLDSVVVHPTAIRQDYQFTVFGRLSAILGVDLFPTSRPNQDIVADQRVDRCDIGNEAFSPSSWRRR